MNTDVRMGTTRALIPSRPTGRVARAAFAAAVLALLATGLAVPSPLVAPAAAATVPAASTTAVTLPAPGSPEAYLFTRVNQVRAQNGLAPLQYRARLGEVAEAWSQEMARVKVLSHNPRISSLIEPGWTAWGENVGFAGGYANNAERIFTGWMNSAGHRANILSTRFTSIGIGAATDSRGYLWSTQDFATYR
ncbi:CAP domain-containing protein [Cellulomonas cellasea]|uniref:SCP domain-containing protein n=2 Tax=Cellulomonas cellasea TaxID=43670 RepID=A0A0A0B1Q3_9CELL|nr:CAP domain-containing protein [Cellulomonas cellasea]KGM00740.1 hypothetical protein Q760_06305 [Cellulomonas cellasea DSM 20118]GEA86708.1 hypothetical protein CCE01nite_06570 [Cellulomonas cellasea]